MADPLVVKSFSEVSLADPLFTSLREDYPGFDKWFRSKADQPCYVHAQDDGALDGFLYLKQETGGVNDVLPALPAKRRTKVGTFKINAHGTKLGERFMKKIFDNAVSWGVEEIYVTVFPKHEALVALFQRYGFLEKGKKVGDKGEELDVVMDYPLLPTNPRPFLLSLYPQWHSRLLPDSLLIREDASIVQDVSHTNSIHKIYLAAMAGVESLRRGDVLVIYRTNDGLGPAEHRSVATSLCVVEEVTHLDRFTDLESFIEYCAPYSVFSSDELGTYYKRRRYPWVIRFTYNLALRKRVNRKTLIEEVGLDRNAYAGFMPLTPEQLSTLLSLAGHDARAYLN